MDLGQREPNDNSFCHAQDKTKDFPRNKIKTYLAIKCKQMVSVHEKMTDQISIGAAEFLFQPASEGKKLATGLERLAKRVLRIFRIYHKW